MSNNPLYGVTIGSTIRATTGKFSLSAVKAPISLMITQTESQKYMSGTSSYVFSEKMNQGSAGLSGAYGISGVSLLKSSLSAYVGKSSAASSKSVSVKYNANAVGGIEYINFEDLTAAGFVASLSKACQQSIITVLDAYLAVVAEVSKAKVDLLKILQKDYSRNSYLKSLVSSWVNASEKFTREFGDGLVVGVIWGAYGGVEMEMTSESESNSWKYGGQADFSYADVFASVAVKAAYDGSQSGGKANVKVNCKSYVSGSALASQIDEWFRQVADKTFNELADVNVINKAPNMDITHAVPSIPDFIQPTPADDIVEKVSEIKDLKVLDTLSQAAAYDQTKKEDPAVSFEEFVNKAEKPAKKEKLDEFKKKIFNNDIDTLSFLNNNKKDKPKKITAEQLKPEVDLNADALLFENQMLNAGIDVGKEVDTKEYVPLGVWISNWANLFPWMAQGFYNSIDHIEGEEAVRARVMLQDYQTLSRMYYVAHSSGITEFKRKDAAQSKVISLNIADAFANAARKMQDAMDVIDERHIMQIYNSLGDAARRIYKFWNEIAFLRNCELGLGLVKDSKTIDKLLPNADKNNNSTRQAYTLTACSFDGTNFTVFNRAYKVLPLLTPDGDIWAFGPEQGGLSSIYDKEVVFSKPGRAKYLIFNYKKEEKILFNKENGIKLHPIPFAAARNVDWKGMSFSTNIGAVGSLNKRLDTLSDQLGELKAWSFGNEYWDKSWNGMEAYRQQYIKKQYIGLIDEIEHVF